MAKECVEPSCLAVHGHFVTSTLAGEQELLGLVMRCAPHNFEAPLFSMSAQPKITLLLHAEVLFNHARAHTFTTLACAFPVNMYAASYISTSYIFNP